MNQTNEELARAVNDALAFLGATPETAGVVLGINGRTLQAMAQGIAPMRSLVIRFADGLARRCEGRDDCPAWWADADAWLRIAGYPPRREMAPAGTAPAPTSSHPAARPAPAARIAPPASGFGSAAFVPAPRPASNGVTATRPAPPAPAASEPPAKEFYRPVYERLSVGDTLVHVFRIVDPDGNGVFQIHVPPKDDYRARAAVVKKDLAELPRTQFERKYGRFRV